MARSLLVLALISTTSSLGAVSEPFPGITLVTNGQSAMIIASLCTPGVAVRATKYGERRGTPQTWASRSGVQVAINADFFDFPGWSLVNGRARGGGEDWPADKQFFESRSYWYFGLFNAGLQENAAIDPAGAPWMTDIVGGHNQLIREGRSLGPSFDGDGVLAGGHRRTAIGLSADRRTLFLMATNKSLDGNGIVAELFALQGEAGGPGIDVATNMDGGGSSQLYVQGLGQVITSGREVNNHLGLYASGAGGSPNCNNLPPRGYLDAVTCDGAKGWSQDVTTPEAAVNVRLQFDDAATVETRADQSRADLCDAIMSCPHGFTRALPKGVMDGKPHTVKAFGLDLENASAWELSDSGKTFTCSAAPPPGVLRHVRDPASFAAWRFDFFDDVQRVSAAEVAARTERAPWPAAPELIQGEGRPEVYFIDGAERRHVPSPAVAAAWRLDLGTVRRVPLSELAKYRLGRPLRDAPWLVLGDGPAIYALDDDATPALDVVSLGVPVLTARGQDGEASSGAGQSERVVGGCSTAAGVPALLMLCVLLARRRVMMR
jgi:hypothetical protein